MSDSKNKMSRRSFLKAAGIGGIVAHTGGLAMAGKVSSDLQDIIRRRPVLFSQLIRELKNLPDRAVVRLVREVRDGEW